MKHDPLSKHGVASKGLLMAAYFFYSLLWADCRPCKTEIQSPSVQGFTTHHPLSSLCPWQQEQLLLSVLPRYIAMELKTEVIKRLSKPKSKEESESNFNNFHSLYIRQHKDVRWWSYHYIVKVMLSSFSVRYNGTIGCLCPSSFPQTFFVVTGLLIITS